MTLLAVTFFALMILGLPIAFAIGLAGFSFFATGPIPMAIGVQQVASRRRQAERETQRANAHSSVPQRRLSFSVGPQSLPQPLCSSICHMLRCSA